jgi:hypothetical protein
MGHYFMEPSNYNEAPIRKDVNFIRSVGMSKGEIRRGSTTDLRGPSARAQ